MCYCGDKLEFSEHCGKLISGEENAKTPLELMKSRYSAFVSEDYKYIYDTYYEKTRNFTIEDLEASNKSSHWVGLEIVDYDNEEGIVTFIAKYRENGFIFEHKEKSKFIFEHKEKSKFIFENDKWYYYGMLPFPKQIKIKPNEPCPCGIGKKYKKCCGK